jgi:hypothetical protein
MQKNLANISLPEAKGVISRVNEFIKGSNGNLSDGRRKQLVGAISLLRKKVEQREKEIKHGKTSDEMIPFNKTNLLTLQSLLP